MKRRIVVADDDPMIIGLISLRLEMGGYEVLAAKNGERALTLVRESGPMAVILDIDMPRMTGLDVLDAIKASPATHDLPVLMLTGERDTATVMRAMDAGASDYMIKPFQPDRLLERMNRLVLSGAQMRDKSAAVWEI
jgi:two-component system phosphate regulon response regulator PhoB